jgi:hypothetical protein
MNSGNPPASPGPGSQTPYDFFLKDQPKLKKDLSLGGGSLKKRLLIAGVGVVVLLMVLIVFMSLVFGGNKGVNQQLLELAQEQTEIVRVADVGVTKSRGAAAKNLAITTKYSVTTSLNELLSLLKKKANGKELGLKKNSRTDQTLDSAATNDNFDEVFTETLQTSLKAYRTNAKKIYDASSGQKTKKVLADAYNGVSVLLDEKTDTQPN